MQKNNIKGLIIGGGIGGLCLAQGLNKAGIHFEVFEPLAGLPGRRRRPPRIPGIYAAVNAGIDPQRFFDSSEDYILWSLIANKREFAKDLNDPHPDLATSVLDKIEHWYPAIKRMVRESDPMPSSFTDS